MSCPYLEYRTGLPGDAPYADAPEDAHAATTPPDGSFDEPRAFCSIAGEFVQPMRADVCNDRYDLDHASHCEIYRAHEDDEPASDAPGGSTDADDEGSDDEGCDDEETDPE